MISPNSTSPLLVPRALLQFLNALPTTGEAAAWVGAFSTLLGEFLSDVDCVVVRVNLHCHLVEARPSRMLGRRLPVDLLGGGHDTPAGELFTTPLIVEAPSYDPVDYGEPIVFRYSFAGDDLGAILLLRSAATGPIGSHTVELMGQLEPFLRFALTDLVARYCYTKPISRLFHEVLAAIAAEKRLTNREMEVLTMHMCGRKYVEIADRLYISIDTVKKHVKKIHRKTGARSATELFARYFTPLIGNEEL